MVQNGHAQSLWRRIRNRFTSDIGIDLGTANTLVFVAGKGILIREPSVVAVSKDNGAVLEVGEEAKRMLGRTPANIVAMRPLRDGVIADFAMTHKMIDKFMRRARHGPTLFQTVVVGIPSGVTEVERDAVLDACRPGSRSWSRWAR
jgi:rod shape-determining protein MreB and related proteins